MNFNSLIPKNYVPREIEKKVFKFLDDKEIIVVRGPRQSGKSTLLLKIALYLQEKYGKENVYFINLEDEIEQFKFEKDPKKYINFYLRGKKRVFIIFDEIQYIKKAGKILKLLYDSLPNVKFIVSGSSTLDINQLGEYLVGRAVFFELYPFNFAEFLKAKDERLYLEYQTNKFKLENPQKTTSLFLDQLNNALKEYLTFGGYPRVVLEKDKDKKIIFLRNLISTYIEKDLIKIYGIKYKEKIIILLKYLSSTAGSLVNFAEISQTVNAHFQEVKQMISILEQTYVIKKILPFHKNLITELKKNPKIYFFDLGFRNILLERFDFNHEEWGKILENYGFLIFKDCSLNFWRTTAKAEVDFVLKDKLIPIEIKTTPKITRSLMSFIDNYKPKTAIILNFNQSVVANRNHTKIFFVPVGLI